MKTKKSLAIALLFACCVAVTFCACHFFIDPFKGCYDADDSELLEEQLRLIFSAYQSQLSKGFLAKLDFPQIEAAIDKAREPSERKIMIDTCIDSIVALFSVEIDLESIATGNSSILTKERSLWDTTENAVNTLCPIIGDEDAIIQFFENMLAKYRDLCFCCSTPLRHEDRQAYRWRIFYSQGMRLDLRNNLRHIKDTLCPFACTFLSQGNKEILTGWTKRFCEDVLKDSENIDRARQ